MKHRSIYMIGILFLAAVVLAACGGGSSSGSSSTDSNQDSSNEGNAEEDSGGDGNMRTYTDSLDREVKIPKNPEDVVAINYFGELSALGIKPVGALEYDLNKYRAELTEGIESVGSEQSDAEKIISLDPDLIVVSNYRETEAIENLQKIAPTVALEFGAPLREQLNIVAEVTGREEAAQEWIQQYEEDVQQAREEMDPYIEEGATAAVMQFYDKNIHMYETSAFPTIYDAAQFEPTEKAAQITDPVTLSEEIIPEYGADHIFVMFSNSTAEENYQQLKQKDVWQSLSAVQNGNVHVVDNEYWSEFNPVLVERQLDTLVSKITESE
ncbi:ABC transporter substrate-binding protein [Salibacterium halotolerans]|uniref:Iron complex transport system substrate-binding protein n=1 Tax=Salibacterium halotolerans TaxID=1884432 RepID=A0A1I5V770_9BACI|nr:ABC transporter substrate-binding protein [Salibacterium halotolerans]SFQ03290.1 iron complex transport system substrate-binding protein [Salibacterium halotolerans]